MMKTVAILAATLLGAIAGCTSTTVSMRGSEVAAADRAADAKEYSTKTPGLGEQMLIARTFLGQPPLVPHTVERYEPITRDENACLECHVTDELRGQKMPKMGKDHFSATAKQADGSPEVEMSRWQCDICHVPQVNAKPLVDNSFVGVTR
jgi:cytochrome c-type protein NapB